MNSKFSNYALGLLLFVGVLSGVIASLTSEDLDSLCNQNNMTLYRYSGTWICGSFGQGITGTKNISVIKDVDLVGLTKTMCYYNTTYSGGIVTRVDTTC